MIIEKMFIQHSTRATRPNSIAPRNQMYDIHLSINAGILPLEIDPSDLQRFLEKALNEYIQR